MSRITFKKIRSLALEAEATVEAIRLGKKHYVVFLRKGWKQGIVTISKTPSDEARVYKNILADIRRELR